MVNIIYLVLVFATSDGGMTSLMVPQASMNQCQINVKNLSKKIMSYGRYDQGVKAHCIAGVK